MTDTIESLRAERDALAVKLWRIANGREDATIDDILYNKQEIQTGVRGLLLDVMADKLDVQIGHQIPDYFKERVTGELKKARMNVEILDMMARDAVRVEVTVSMQEQTMCMDISKGDLRYYTQFVEDQKRQAAPRMRDNPKGGAYIR